jgi:hypothetical protein
VRRPLFWIVACFPAATATGTRAGATVPSAAPPPQSAAVTVQLSLVNTPCLC